MSVPLDMPVLVLNRYWQPVRTCSARRAVHLLCLGHPQVVQVEGEQRFTTHDLGSWIGYSSRMSGLEMIHSVRVALGVPKIITPISPPSGPTQWLFQGPPAESKLLAVSLGHHGRLSCSSSRSPRGTEASRRRLCGIPQGVRQRLNQPPPWTRTPALKRSARRWNASP
jgi:hypothetical protein